MVPDFSGLKYLFAFAVVGFGAAVLAVLGFVGFLIWAVCKALA